MPGSGTSVGGSSGSSGSSQSGSVSGSHGGPGGIITGGTCVGGGPENGGKKTNGVAGGSALPGIVGGTRPVSTGGTGLYPAIFSGTGRGVKKNGWRPSAGLLRRRNIHN